MAYLRSDILSQELFLNAVRHHEKTKNVEIISITTGEIEEGLQETVQVEVRASVRRKEVTYNWTAKIASRNDSVGNAARDISVWETERKFYREVLPYFDIEGEKAEILVPTHAELVYSTLEAGKECMLMTDLGCAGFESLPEGQPLELTIVLQAVEWLAKLHALGYKYINSMRDLDLEWLNDTVPLAGQVDPALVKLAQTGHSPDNSVLTDYASRLETLFTSEAYGQICREVLGPRGDFTTVCHGRPCAANIRTWSAEGVIMETILVNFDEARMCQPGVDLAILLYSSTDRAFRRDQLSNVLKRYHASLLDYLLELGYNTDTYPFSQLFEDYQEAVVPAVGISINTIPGLLGGGQDVTDGQSSENDQGNILKDLVEELVELKLM